MSSRAVAPAGGIVLALALASTASADHGTANPPTTILIPPGSAPADVQPGPVRHCRKARIGCVRRVVRRMTQRWRPLDRHCDHRAVFGLTYLRTTEEVLGTLLEDKRFFSDRAHLIYQDVIFGDYYFRAYDDYVAGRGVPRAWRIAFDAAIGDGNGGDTTAVTDVLLGANAHIQRDLPYALADVGLRHPNGASRKPDHDAVNEILSRVLDRIQDEAARRYDPAFELSDLKPLPVDEVSVLELIKGWREGAWRNAERLLRAETRRERRRVSRSIGLTAALTASSIVRQGTVPGYGARRDAYCEAQQAARRLSGPAANRRRS